MLGDVISDLETKLSATIFEKDQEKKVMLKVLSWTRGCRVCFFVLLLFSSYLSSFLYLFIYLFFTVYFIFVFRCLFDYFPVYLWGKSFLSTKKKCCPSAMENQEKNAQLTSFLRLAKTKKTT